MRGRHGGLDVYHVSQSLFGLPRQSLRNNSDRIILFKPTSKVVESMYKGLGVYDIAYWEFKEMCLNA